MQSTELLRRCLLPLLFGVEGLAQPSVEFFPGDKIFPRFRADALAHQLSLSKVTDNREWIGAIGGQVPIVNVADGDLTVQFGIGASVFNRIIKTSGHITVFTVDYRVDFPVDVKLKEIVLRIGYGHISNHYADDGIEILQRRSINAVKDYIQVGVARAVGIIAGEVYAAALYNYHTEPLPDRRWVLQAGGGFGNTSLASWLWIYGAIDLKLKEEVNWGSTQSYQVGFRFVPRAEYALRLAYTFRTGFEERGQLYNQSVAASLISLFIDF
ncbi:MAG: hypothetical protein AB1428_14905 [Bacteroidota bacterium]